MLLRSLPVVLLALLLVPRGANAAIIMDSAGDLAIIGGGDAFVYVPLTQIMPGNTSNTFLQFNDDNDADDVEFGYNTTHNLNTVTGTDDEKTASSLKLSEVPNVVIGGITYLEFALAIQESGNTDPLIITSIKLAVVADPDLTSYPATTVFSFGGGNTIELNNVYPGTNLDMILYVKKSLVAALPGGPTVTFLSLFSRLESVSGGNEEWLVSRGPPVTPFVEPPVYIFTPSVPEPSGLALASCGALVLAFARRRRAAVAPVVKA
jgi:hypothetical protein